MKSEQEWTDAEFAKMLADDAEAQAEEEARQAYEDFLETEGYEYTKNDGGYYYEREKF